LDVYVFPTHTLPPQINFLHALYLVSFLAILTNIRDIAVWILFPVVFISLDMSPFLRPYFPFLPVYHQMSPILPCLLLIVILLIQHNYFTNSPCQHLVPRQLSHHLPRHPPHLLLLSRHHQALPRHLPCRGTTQPRRGATKPCRGTKSCQDTT
jgi:hypothetical protein